MDYSTNVIHGLCHSYSGKVVTFQESFFACKRKLSKPSRLLRQAATGNCLDRLGCVTVRLTTAITCDTDSWNFAVDRGQVESRLMVAVGA